MIPKPVAVKVTTLDSWWRRTGCPQCDFVKIDVEGFERHVLKGASSFIAGHRNNTNCLVMMEVNRPALESAGSSVTEVWNEIAALGLQVAMLDEMADGAAAMRALNSEQFSMLSGANIFLCPSVELLNPRIANGSALR